MKTIRALIQGPLLLLAILYGANESYRIKVIIEAAGPDTGGSAVSTQARTTIVNGKLVYDLT